MVAYSAMTTVAAHNGYGRNDLTPEENVDATYYRMIGQTFSLIATGASKASVGFFLLRLVVVPWQIISIQVIMVVMGILSILNSFFTWLACTPLEYGWNEPLGGSCFNTVPPAVMLACKQYLEQPQLRGLTDNTSGHCCRRHILRRPSMDIHLEAQSSPT